jgi:hypothetical protein
MAEQVKGSVLGIDNLKVSVPAIYNNGPPAAKAVLKHTQSRRFARFMDTRSRGRESAQTSPSQTNGQRRLTSAATTEKTDTFWNQTQGVGRGVSGAVASAVGSGIEFAQRVRRLTRGLALDRVINWRWGRVHGGRLAAR